MRGGAVLLGAGFAARPRVAFLCAPGPGEKARRGAGAGSNAGPKGHCGPGGLRSRVATESRASRAEAARGRLRSALARRRPPRSEFLAPGTSRVRRVLGVLLRLLGNGESRVALGALVPASSSKPALRWNRLCGRPAAWVFETRLPALPRAEVEGGLLLYNRRLGSHVCLLCTARGLLLCPRQLTVAASLELRSSVLDPEEGYVSVCQSRAVLLVN